MCKDREDMSDSIDYGKSALPLPAANHVGNPPRIAPFLIDSDVLIDALMPRTIRARPDAVLCAKVVPKKCEPSSGLDWHAS
jgi:hypothetical protein